MTTAPGPAAVGSEMVPEPPTGRIVRTERRVRLGDVSPRGFLRLDALVRYLQDVATDDSRNVDLTPDRQWVVRRTALVVHALPAYESEIQLATWCGGIGSHWAERRTTVRTPDRVLVDAATLWVQVDGSMRPARVDDRFRAVYAEAARGRRVSSRLEHAEPSAETVADAEPWPLRHTDLDALGHVNNAASWAAVEERRAAVRGLQPPLRASVEHRRPIEAGAQVRLAVDDTGDGFACWLVDPSGAVLVSGEVHRG